MTGLCHQLRKTHPLFVIACFAPSTNGQEDWIFRPRWPGLVPFFLYALGRCFLLLWKNPEIKVMLGGSALVMPIVLLLAKAFRRKAVVIVHGSDLTYRSLLYQGLCVQWIRHCDGVVANSDFTASLAEAKKARKDSIHVIHPGVDTESFEPFRAEDLKRELGLEGKKILLYVGRLVRRKGLKEFLEKSFNRIAEEVPEVCLLVVGENPKESLIHRDDVLSELMTMVEKMRLENQVRLLGWLGDGDLVKIYQLSDLMVLPALSMKDDVEGFGMVILEAAVAGKPCVATRVGGIPDAIEDGKSGILIEPEDYELMSRTIVNLLQDDQARRALGGCAWMLRSLGLIWVERG